MILMLSHIYYRVFMRGVTWIRDSHGLFDYESKNISKKSWTTNEQARVLRVDNDIDIVPFNKEKN